MSTRARQYDAEVLRRTRISDHLVRLVLGGPGLAGFASTGVPDEWVGLVVPGQFQSRYYTVRSWEGGELTLDVVIHDEGLVTEWATRGCVGDTVTISEAKGSFALPDDAVAEVGEETARVWGLYMAGSRLAFERNEIQLHHVLATKTVDGVSGYPLRHTFGV